MPLHGDKYGCEYEYGDRVVPGAEWGQRERLLKAARGPCGCTAVTVREYESTEDRAAADLSVQRARCARD